MWFVFRPEYLPEPDDETYESELRKCAMAVLMRFFPEAAALSPLELEAAIHRIITESNPETASEAAPGMVRFSDRDIRIWLQTVETPTVDDLLGADAGGVFPPGWIEARRREMEEECRPETPGHTLTLVDKIRVDLIAKGYAEVMKEYVEPDYDPYVI
jgi:hypothetical protein